MDENQINKPKRLYMGSLRGDKIKELLDCDLYFDEEEGILKKIERN